MYTQAMSQYLLVNFGGPRDLDEVAPFLVELLRDRDMIRTRMPTWLHNWIFGRAARKRAVKIREDYRLIGGRSPIYFDTEALASALSKKLQAPVIAFHRYLTATHREFFQKVKGEYTVLPLFPQFCYATTGSVARFLSHLKLEWIKSYPAHPAYVAAFQRRIREFLAEKNILEEETLLLFSAHGIPAEFVEQGDPYESECNLSYQAILKGFPKAKGLLSYQSKFGPGEWLRPYTNEVCEAIEAKNVVIIPLSFTSDHIETLFEIEHLYLPPISARGLNAFRCPALNLEPYWIEALAEIAKEKNKLDSKKLIR